MTSILTAEVLIEGCASGEVLFLEGQGNSMRIDLTQYSLGTYLAKVRVDDAVKTVKLIKQ